MSITEISGALLSDEQEKKQNGEANGKSAEKPAEKASKAALARASNAGGKRIKKPKGWIAKSIAVFKWFLLVLSLLIALALALLFFFPVNLAKDYALEEINQKTQNTTRIGDISYWPLSGIDIEDIFIGAPEGYTKPIFTAKRLNVEYQIADFSENVFVIDEIILTDAEVNIELIDGRSNIEAYLEPLLAGEKKEDEAAEAGEEEAPAGVSPSYQIVLQALKIVNFSASFSDGNHEAKLARVDVNLAGNYSDKSSEAKLSVSISQPLENQANVHFKQKSPEPLDASIAYTLDIAASAKNLLSPSAEMTLSMALDTKDVQSRWEIAPVSLGLSLQANADMQKDEAALRRLTIRFNEEEMLDCKGALDGILQQKHAKADIEKLYLPLDAFAPIVKAFLPTFDFGGEISVDSLAVESEIPKLIEMGLPNMKAKLKMKDVWAKYRPMKAQVRGVNVDIALASVADTTSAANETAAKANIGEASEAEDDLGRNRSGVFAKGKIAVQSAKMDFAEIEGLMLDLNLYADSVKLSDVSAELDLAVNRLRYEDAALGVIETDLKLMLDGGGNVEKGAFTLRKLEANVADILKLQANATADIDLATMNVRRFSLDTTFLPLQIEKAIAFLPEPLKARLPKMSLSGEVGLALEAKGGLSLPIGDPLLLPIHVKSRVSLQGIRLDYPDQALLIQALNGGLRLEGKPNDMKLTGVIDAARIEKNDLTLNIQNVHVPLSLHFRPKSAKLALGLDAKEIRKQDLALKIETLAFKLDATFEGDLLALGIEHAGGEIKLTTAKLIYAKDLSLALDNQRMLVRFGHEHKTKIGDARIDWTIEQIDLPQERINFQDVALNLKSRTFGVELPLRENFDAHAERAGLEIDLTFGDVNVPDIFMQPLKATRLQVSTSLKDMRDFHLDRFRLDQPSLGVTLDVHGEVLHVLDAALAPPDFQTRFPEFDLHFFSGFDLAEEKELLEGMRASGKAGLKARLRSLPDNRAMLEGLFLSEDFSYLLTEKTMENRKGEAPLEKTRRIRIDKFNASVPIVQRIDLAKKAPMLSKGNILTDTASGVIYDTMRIYGKEDTNFHLTGLHFEEEAGKMKRAITIDEIAMDMLYDNGNFSIARMYVAMLGGGITGALKVQLVQLPPDPFDVRIHFENQITGVNLAYLTEQDAKNVTKETEISSLINLDFGLLDRFVEGRVDLTQLSLMQLDKLLRFLDPAGADPKVQENIDLINAWYVTMFKPQIDLVSMWVKYGNMNMDIKMDAVLVGAILQAALDNSRIRRLNIMEILKDYLPGEPEVEQAETATIAD